MASIIGEATPSNAGPLIFALDPASQRTGWALSTLRGEILRSGVIAPPASAERVERMRLMGKEVARLLYLHGQERILAAIETTSGKKNVARNASGVGLSVYGMAVGYLLAVLELHLGESRVTHYTENEWIGRRSKGARQVEAHMLCPTYNPSADPGGDESDAIMLAQYHRSRLALEKLIAQQGESNPNPGGTVHGAHPASDARQYRHRVAAGRSKRGHRARLKRRA